MKVKLSLCYSHLKTWSEKKVAKRGLSFCCLVTFKKKMFCLKKRGAQNVFCNFNKKRLKIF